MSNATINPTATTRTARTTPLPEISPELRRSSPKGAFAIFVPIAGTDKGIKFYGNRELRDQSYKNQRKLANKGIAPACDDCFDSVDSDGREVYGFWTTVAEVIDRERYNPWCGRYDESYAKWVDAEYNKLRAKVRKAGCEWRDDHNGNVGFIAGRAVIIDCADDLFGSGDIGLAY